MAKSRWKDVKQGKIIPNNKIHKKDYTQYASSGVKIKAFLTDSFMLLLPIVYGVIYLIMEGREDFSSHKLIGWIYIIIPLIIVQTIFLYKTGQTPGYRAFNLILVDEKTKEIPSLGSILFRNLTIVLSVLTFIGWTVMFIRKDHKTLHDFLSATSVIYKK